MRAGHISPPNDLGQATDAMDLCAGYLAADDHLIAFATFRRLHNRRSLRGRHRKVPAFVMANQHQFSVGNPEHAVNGMLAFELELRD